MKNRMVSLLIGAIMIFAISECTTQADVSSDVALDRKENIHYNIAAENI